MLNVITLSVARRIRAALRGGATGKAPALRLDTSATLRFVVGSDGGATLKILNKK